MKVSEYTSIRRHLAAAVAAVCAGVASPQLFGQEDVMLLEEVLVTARKVLESAQDVPVAVSAFSGDAVDDLIMRDIRELEGFIPNVVIDSVSVAPGAASLYVRGVGTQEVERSFDPAVGFVVDGVSLSFVNGSMANTFDFASIEVLRGPQGTLFGRNTTGGVINVRHTRPTGELGLRYELTAGDNDRTDVKAVLNFPIAEGTLAGKLAYATQQDGGQLTNKFNGEQVGDRDNTEITATLLWTPSDSFEAQFIYTDYTDENDGIPLANRSQVPELVCALFAQCGGGPIDEVNQDFLSPIEFDLEAYTLEMSWQFEMGTLTSVSGYRETDEFVPTDFDGTPLSFLHVTRAQDSEQTSTELRFASNEAFSESWDFVAGFYWLEDEYYLDQKTAVIEVFGPDLTGNGAIYQDPFTDHERETMSVFGEAHFSLSDQLNLTVGGRYTREEKEIAAGNFVAFGLRQNFFPAGFVEADEDWSEFTPKIGLDYKVSDDILIYGSYSEGFRSGGFNGRNYTPADIGPFDPEFVNQFEFGMKGDYADGKVRLNLAAFMTDYEDKQEEVIQPDPFGATLTVVENASSVNIWGLEGELTWVMTDHFVLNANFGYLDAEYDDYKADLTGDGVVTDNSSLELRRVPEWTGGINGNYSRRIGSGTLSAFVGYRYTDEYQVDVGNAPQGLLDSRAVVDASLSYEWEWDSGRTVKVSAYGRDLGDEQGFNSAVVVPPLFTFGAVTGGKHFGVQISGNF